MPWVRFYLRELKLLVIRIHAPNLLPGWSTQDLSRTDLIVSKTTARFTELEIYEQRTLII